MQENLMFPQGYYPFYHNEMENQHLFYPFYNQMGYFPSELQTESLDEIIVKKEEQWYY